MWVAEHLDEKELVLSFLNQQEKNTIENGYVQLVVYSSTGETNLQLDDHKKLQLYTKDENILQTFIRLYKKLGYAQTDDFYNLQYGFYHWHYRPAGSLSRPEFTAMLKAEKFVHVETWVE